MADYEVESGDLPEDHPSKQGVPVPDDGYGEDEDYASEAGEQPAAKEEEDAVPPSPNRPKSMPLEASVSEGDLHARPKTTHSSDRSEDGSSSSRSRADWKVTGMRLKTILPTVYSESAWAGGMGTGVRPPKSDLGKEEKIAANVPPPTPGALKKLARKTQEPLREATPSGPEARRELSFSGASTKDGGGGRPPNPRKGSNTERNALHGSKSAPSVASPALSYRSPYALEDKLRELKEDWRVAKIYSKALELDRQQSLAGHEEHSEHALRAQRRQAAYNRAKCAGVSDWKTDPNLKSWYRKRRSRESTPSGRAAREVMENFPERPQSPFDSEHSFEQAMPHTMRMKAPEPHRHSQGGNPNMLHGARSALSTPYTPSSGGLYASASEGNISASGRWRHNTPKSEAGPGVSEWKEDIDHHLWWDDMTTRKKNHSTVSKHLRHAYKEFQQIIDDIEVRTKGKRQPSLFGSGDKDHKGKGMQQGKISDDVVLADPNQQGGEGERASDVRASREMVPPLKGSALAMQRKAQEVERAHTKASEKKKLREPSWMHKPHQEPLPPSPSRLSAQQSTDREPGSPLTWQDVSEVSRSPSLRGADLDQNTTDAAVWIGPGKFKTCRVSPKKGRSAIIDDNPTPEWTPRAARV